MHHKGKESEHNWSLRDGAIQRVRGMLKGEAHIRYSEAFYACLKEGFMQWSLKTVRVVQSAGVASDRVISTVSQSSNDGSHEHMLLVFGDVVAPRDRTRSLL